MSIFPKKWQGRLIPMHNIPEFYVKNGIKYETRTNKEVVVNYISEKDKYIAYFLDGYFSDKKIVFGMKYHSELSLAIGVAEKKWKKHKFNKKTVGVFNKIIFIAWILQSLVLCYT